MLPTQPTNILDHAAPKPVIPGAAMDTMLLLSLQPNGTDGRANDKKWLWLVELRVSMGIISQCHSVGFAIAMADDPGLIVTVDTPIDGVMESFLNQPTGFVAWNKNFASIESGALDGLTAGFMINGTKKLNGEPGMPAIPQMTLPPADISERSVFAAAADGLKCPGLGSISLRRALESELAFLTERRAQELIAREETIEPVVLGANDNLSQPGIEPAICDEPPVFEDRKIGAA
ncbi:MAG: hypothetical protein KI792_13215 [Alphaproteobacteria bacterium]|nr:hypothetical protein [Alphaproteobacteria bacterium SS10]